MASPSILQHSFRFGMRRDTARQDLPQGAVWDMINFLPDRFGAPLARRGGWTRYDATQYGSFVDSMVDVQTTDANERKLFTYYDSATTSYKVEANVNGGAFAAVSGTTYAASQNPIFHRDNIIFMGSAGPTIKKWTSTGGISTLTTTGVAARYGTVYRDRTVIANANVGPYAVYFGPPGDPSAAWDVTSAVYSTTGEVTGLASLQNAVLVFHRTSVERLVGTTPAGYGITGIGDISLQPLFDGVGCADAFSIVKWNQSVIWADLNGVYLTDGASFLDLTQAGGIKTWFPSYLSQRMTAVNTARGAGTARIVSGVYGNYLFLTVGGDGPALTDTLVCNLQTRSWFRLSNIGARCYARSANSSDLYFGSWENSGGFVNSMAPIFTEPVSGGHDLDGNATPCSAFLSTGYFVPTNGPVRWKDLYLSYELNANVGNTKQISTTANLSPANTTTAQTLSVFPGASVYTRLRRPIGKVSDGISFDFTIVDPTTYARIHSIGADINNLEPSKQLVASGGKYT